MKKKEICFVTQCSLPIPVVKGGAVETLIEYLSNINETEGKYNFTIISLYNEKAQEKSNEYLNSKYIYVKSKNKYISKIYNFIYRILKKISIYIPFTLEFRDVIKILKNEKDKYDLVIYEGGPTTQLPILSKIIDKDKLVCHLHWNGMSNDKKDKSFNSLIAVSQYIGNEWRKNVSNKNRSIYVLSNCADVGKFSKEISFIQKENLRKKLNISKNDFVIIFTGRIVEEKGIMLLLNAIEKLEENNVVLLMIGSANFGKKTYTSFEKKINNKIKKANKKIVKLGYVPQDELYKYYNISDLAVIPSLFQDPAPLVMIETQLTGIPIIATNVGGIQEYASSQVELIEKDKNLENNLVSLISKHIKNNIKIRINEEKNYAKKFNINNYYKSFSTIVDRIIDKK